MFKAIANSMNGAVAVNLFPEMFAFVLKHFTVGPSADNKFRLKLFVVTNQFGACVGQIGAPFVSRTGYSRSCREICDLAKSFEMCFHAVYVDRPQILKQVTSDQSRLLAPGRCVSGYLSDLDVSVSPFCIIVLEDLLGPMAGLCFSEALGDASHSAEKIGQDRCVSIKCLERFCSSLPLRQSGLLFRLPNLPLHGVPSQSGSSERGERSEDCRQGPLIAVHPEFDRTADFLVVSYFSKGRIAAHALCDRLDKQSSNGSSKQQREGNYRPAISHALRVRSRNWGCKQSAARLHSFARAT